MKPLVLLFDVDGTLVRTGGAGGRALARAFGTLFERPDAPGRVDVRGNTDGAIIAEALRAVGHEPTEDLATRVLETYLEALADEVARAPGYALMPGVVALLESLHGREGLALGLGTGNVERGARIKLERGGLARYFRFGGYGSDSAHRPTLVRRGAERGASLLAAAPEQCRVVVVGDTPRDVSAAHANGAEVVAVATGGHPLEELEGLGASLVVPTLDDARVREFLR